MLFWKQPPGRRRSIMSSPGALWSSAETRGKKWSASLKEGIKRNRSDKAAIFGKGYEKYIPAAIYTARVLEQAPVIVFFINSKGKDYYGEFPDRRASDGNGGHPVGERGDPEYVPGSDGEEYRDAVDLQYFLCL